MWSDVLQFEKGGIRRGCFQPLASLAILYVVEEIGNPFLGIRQPENRSDCCLSVLTKPRNQFLTLGSVHSPLLCTDQKLEMANMNIIRGALVASQKYVDTQSGTHMVPLPLMVQWCQQIKLGELSGVPKGFQFWELCTFWKVKCTT